MAIYRGTILPARQHTLSRRAANHRAASPLHCAPSIHKPRGILMENIANKTVIITGASSGLGAETARHLVQNGAHVILGARRLDRRRHAAVAARRAESGRMEPNHRHQHPWRFARHRRRVADDESAKKAGKSSTSPPSPDTSGGHSAPSIAPAKPRYAPSAKRCAKKSNPTTSAAPSSRRGR